MTGKLVNWEVAVYALHLLGGASRPIHTEDVALKCFDLAPESFSWIRYPEHPDKDIARVALTDARKAKAGALVSGRAGKGSRRVASAHDVVSTDGWVLTESGVQWVLGHEARLAETLGQKITAYHRQDVLQKLQRVRKHRLFEVFMRPAQRFTPSLGELADLLRCRVDADEPVWKKRIELLRNQALIASQEDVLAFVNACDTRIDQLLAGETNDDVSTS
jgi:hypothetical protein